MQTGRGFWASKTLLRAVELVQSNGHILGRFGEQNVMQG
jgi:hypothetical protein